ncbi:polynucleotide adenylyltransferase PcnB [Treponema pectinovorum]|uniref:polynucleotide adenylyltransferase PcnB n=1 Tax=Treponema pectinovorum TaxID=164 RepID=UPI0011C785FE|nr:polynucleotide adenylyltransferase PcnB [Treponema pectinovorum]
MLYRYSKDRSGHPVKKAIIYTKNEHKIPVEKIDSDCLKVVSHLKDCGFDTYIVGGAVRDLLVGKEPKDFDIVTSATPSKIKKLFRNSRIIGKRFRLVHVFFDEKIFEVSTFRSTVAGSVGNSFGSIEEDVQRRDFTLNSLYYDPIKEQVIDYVGGVQDIKNRVLKPVIPLNRIFEEDPVRMLRAVKYSATCGCKMGFFLKRKIRKSAHLLLPVSPSRLTEEMLKILNSGHAYDIISSCLETDLYMYLQPNATNLMYESKKFERSYMQNLLQMDNLVQNDKTVRLGQKLTYLIGDFINTLTDWKKEVSAKTATGELYLKTWTQVRNFVLPINPQRTELEYAIRVSLKNLGVGIKIPKNAFTNKRERTKTVKSREQL